MQFTMNLKGQVNQMRLPKTKALWPLFETIVNSIQSLEDMKDCLRPIITTDGGEELTHFEDFLVTDNGQGFTKENYASFLEAYSPLKLQKG